MRVIGLMLVCASLCAVFTLLILRFTGLSLRYSALTGAVFSVLIFLMFDLKSAQQRPGDSIIIKISKRVRGK